MRGELKSNGLGHTVNDGKDVANVMPMGGEWAGEEADQKEILWRGSSTKNW